jgi:hypothetical protein
MVRLGRVAQPLEVTELPMTRRHASPVISRRLAPLLPDLPVAGGTIDLHVVVHLGIQPPRLLHVVPNILLRFCVHRRT